MLQGYKPHERRHHRIVSKAHRRRIGEYYDAKLLRFEQLEQRWLVVADPVAGDDSLTTGEDSVLTVAPAGTYAADVLADSPFADWRLGESSGTNANNEIAGEVDGNYINSPLLGTSGLIAADTDTAVTFDGIDQHVAIPDDADINTGGPYVSKSVELWFQANDVLSQQVLYEQGGGSRGLNLYIDGGRFYVGAWNTPNDLGPSTPWDLTEGTSGGLFLGTDISAGQTYHGVFVMDGDADGTTGTLTGYLNGCDLASPRKSGDFAV